uniref:Uncharacterized protein n=1 Tax=Arundo donax TaxID=35708 RepID=A0A0A9BZS0_ARUDO
MLQPLVLPTFYGRI